MLVSGGRGIILRWLLCVCVYIETDRRRGWRRARDGRDERQQDHAHEHHDVPVGQVSV